MTETALQPNIMVYYIDPETGRPYVEMGSRIFELEIGDDVTDEVPSLSLEAMMVYDPESTDDNLETLRIESVE